MVALVPTVCGFLESASQNREADAPELGMLDPLLFGNQGHGAANQGTRCKVQLLVLGDTASAQREGDEQRGKAFDRRGGARRV